MLTEIKHELRLTVFTDKLDLLTDRVIGNWMVFGVKHLTDRIPEITYKQLHSIILDISNSFKEIPSFFEIFFTKCGVLYQPLLAIIAVRLAN